MSQLIGIKLLYLYFMSPEKIISEVENSVNKGG